MLDKDSSSVSVRALVPISRRGGRVRVRARNNVILPTHFFDRVMGGLTSRGVAVRIGSRFRAGVASTGTSFAVGKVSMGGCPGFPIVSSGRIVALPATLFGRIVRRAMVTASARRDHPVLAKIGVAVGSNGLATITASDRQLDRQVVSVTTPRSRLRGGCGIVVPKGDLMRLSQVIRGRPAVRVVVARGRILFGTRGICFCSHLLRNCCPSAGHLVPTDSDARVILGTCSLLRTASHTSLLSRRKGGGIIGLSVSSGGIRLSKGSPRINGIRRSLTCRSTDNSPLVVSFGPSCVGSTLHAFNRRSIRIGFASTMQPFAIMPTSHRSRGSGSFVRLVAPMEAC